MSDNIGTMKMQLTTSVEGGIVRAVAAGAFALDEAKEQFVRLLDAVAEHQAVAVLFDGRELMGDPQAIEQFFYGEFAAAAYARHRVIHGLSTRFAYVLKEPVLDPRRYGESVAASQGMEVKAFDDIAVALAWLRA